MNKDSTAPPDSGELEAYLAWQSLPGIGRTLLLKIRDHFGSFLFAWNAVKDSDETWQQLLTKTQAQRQAIRPRQIRDELLFDNPDIITLLDSDYPTTLRSGNPEPLLFYRGNRQLLQAPIMLGIVGSRRFDRYNAEALKSIFTGLTDAPIVIVSGLALGIDGLAHQLALDYQLPTIAIPGSSILDEEIYPRSHVKLSRQIIAADGLLLSPFAKGTPMANHLFPYRNAVIAGLCHSLLVVSAASKSGALITAQQAMDFGRDVLAVPGNIDQELSRGTNQLIRQGAVPITSGEDIMRHFNFEPRSPDSHSHYPSANELENAIIRSLTLRPATIEDLLQQLPSYPTNQILICLASMELKRWIERGNKIRLL